VLNINYYENIKLIECITFFYFSNTHTNIPPTFYSQRGSRDEISEEMTVYKNDFPVTN
jgi:hypothetical protein